MSRRVAAHKSRRCSSTAEREAPSEAAHQSANSVAAQAAARVAARYAKAPTYSQMQAAEAITAVRAAEIATRVAREAQASARAVLAGIESASREKAKPEPQPPVAPSPAATQVLESPTDPAETSSPQSIQSHPLPIHLEPEFELEPRVPRRPAEPGTSVSAQHYQHTAVASDPIEQWWQAPEPPANDPLGVEKLDRLQAALPDLSIHANLIEFPRAAAPARKHHSRPAEELQASAAHQAQLSIFEVDPGAVSFDAQAATAQPNASPWSGIELEEQPLDELDLDPEPSTKVHAIEVASFARRLLAAVVDCALITGAFLAAALVAASRMEHLPALRSLELGAVPALFAIGLLYFMLFFTLADATPGMTYARVSLCALDGQYPTRAQLHGRLGAMLLSLLPLGLGLAWAIFDEDHLSWHDRLSRTYQRRCW